MRKILDTTRVFIAIEPRVLPEPERDWKWIDGELAPPRNLVTLAMKLAVVDPTNRDGELVADSVPKCTRLHKREMMRIRRRPTAYKTRLPVLLIAQANRFAQGADCAIARRPTGYFRSFLAIARIRPAVGHHVSDGSSIGWLAGALGLADGRESRLKFLTEPFVLIDAGAPGWGTACWPSGVIPKADYIKIDVEGFEQDVLLGGRPSRKLPASVSPIRYRSADQVHHHFRIARIEDVALDTVERFAERPGVRLDLDRPVRLLADPDCVMNEYRRQLRTHQRAYEQAASEYRKQLCIQKHSYEQSTSWRITAPLRWTRLLLFGAPRQGRLDE